MTRPCVVSFAPGSGGNFVGHICQHVIHGTKFVINNNGSCHAGKVVNWGHDSIVINNSIESVANEIKLIQTSAPDTDSVVVTHSRNIKELSAKFQRTVWISFSHNDIDTISSNFRGKNAHRVYEHSYNNIKDVNWPTYDQYLSGSVPPEIQTELHKRLYVDPYVDWTWIIPADFHAHKIFELPFSKVLTPEVSDVYNLCKFVDPNVDANRIQYVTQQWQDYCSKQKQYN